MDINERLANLEKVVEELKAHIRAVKSPTVAIAPVVSNSSKVSEELVNLLHSKQWPYAVDPSLIVDVNSEQDKEDRAEGILDLIMGINLENLKFLDFGCGDGHVVNRSHLQKPKLSVGYDIKHSERWVQWGTPSIFTTDWSTPSIFTTDWSEVKKSGPFDIVLLYDVVDHMLCSDTELIEKLKEIKGMLSPGGRVFVRTHPFCSRHGTHLYHQINKAFVHLVFSEDELTSLGYKQEPTRKVKHPLNEYNNFFTLAGFKIQNGPHQLKEGVDPFFINTPIVAQRIKNNYQDSTIDQLKKGKFPTHQLEQQFVDYVLI
jgi:2-polyprenyl-3-methyl-5-hydroxy-6-metoxy-1,4-benzoquinol methylase